MNAKTLVFKTDMNRQEWLEWRKKGIGGSDVAAIAGLSKWKSPIAVWLEKTNQIEPEEPGEPAYWGTVLEAIVANEFSIRTGKKLREHNAILQHNEYPWMIANIDREVVGENAGLECKTANEYFKDEWDEDTGKLPDAYMLQIQHYMAVTGLNKWHVAVLIGGNKFKHFAIERDQEIIDHLIQIEADFWKLVEAGTPPEVDGSDATKELLGRMYPNSTENAVELPAGALELIDDRQHYADQEGKMKLLKQECENKLKQLLGDNEAGTIGDSLVKWKTVNTNKLDSKRLKAEKPELYADYCKESSYRKFDIKGA